VAITQLVISE